MRKESTRNMTLSTKVAPEQKAEYSKIAQLNNISLSEWASSIIEMNKYSYNQFGEPTKAEIVKDRKISKLESEINRLNAKIESADHKVELEMKRADNAISKRDEDILKLKKMESEYRNLEIEITKLITKDSSISKKSNIIMNENKTLIVPAISVASLVLGIIIGKK
jgi:hypothetical protein